jgi:DNA-binding MarR family transcriptional regulator
MPPAVLKGRSDPDIDNPLDGLLGYQLRRASATILADLARSIEDLGFKPAEASVLLLIGRNPGITQSEIGRTLAIQRANMAPLTAMLTDRDLVERTRADGRSQGLMLTPAGDTMAKTLADRVEAHEARFLPALSPRERRDLIDLVRRIWL